MSIFYFKNMCSPCSVYWGFRNWISSGAHLPWHRPNLRNRIFEASSSPLHKFILLLFPILLTITNGRRTERRRVISVSCLAVVFDLVSFLASAPDQFHQLVLQLLTFLYHNTSSFLSRRFSIYTPHDSSTIARTRTEFDQWGRLRHSRNNTHLVHSFL